MSVTMYRKNYLDDAITSAEFDKVTENFVIKGTHRRKKDGEWFDSPAAVIEYFRRLKKAHVESCRRMLDAAEASLNSFNTRHPQ